MPAATLNFVPAATQEHVASAPGLAPPALSTPIVLPAVHQGEMRVDQGQAVTLNERVSEDETLKQGKFEFMLGKERSFSDEPGAVALTNGGVNGQTVVTVDPDTHILTIDADPKATQEILRVVKNLDKNPGQAQGEAGDTNWLKDRVVALNSDLYDKSSRMLPQAGGA